MKSSITTIFTALLASFTAARVSSCKASTLNTTVYLYPITKPNTTIFDVAEATNRGVCDIGRQNLMADVTITPNVGQQILIPPQTCSPDNDTCLLPQTNTTRTCINGGPRLYYTVNGDTYERIAQRLNITAESLIGKAHGDETLSATDALEPGQFIKVPLCEPSQCVVQPYSFTWGVYKDIAEAFGTTVGQIMMLSPTYNYSSVAFMSGGTFPPINVLVNCTESAGNVTVLD